MTKRISVSRPTEAAAEVFDDAGACQFLLTNSRMLRKMRREYGLPFIRISNKFLRYRKADLIEWLARRRVAISN